MKPLVIDLYCGLGGWSRAFIDEGYEAVGFDVERHVYGEKRYPGQLVLQDVLTLDGSQLKDAAVIVASSPCQKYSYMAMPWTRAKEQAKWYREDPARIEELNALFLASFRLQREASEAAGRYIPLVAENVKGAQPWVGMAKAHFGSYYLWGDIESVGNRITCGKFGQSLAPGRRIKMGRAPLAPNGGTRRLTNPGEWRAGDTHEYGRGLKVPGIKLSEVGFNVAAARMIDGVNKPEEYRRSPEMVRSHIGFSRKAASAMIAEIPYDLAVWIARAFKPANDTARFPPESQRANGGQSISLARPSTG